MGSHFESIGFSYEHYTEQEGDEVLGFGRLAEWAANRDEIVVYVCDEGNYIRLSTPTGGELWVQANSEWQLIGMHPHFAGGSIVEAKLVDHNRVDEHTPLDGGFACRIDDPTAKTQATLYFDCPDMKLWRDLELPAVMGLQVAVFADFVNIICPREEYDNGPSLEIDGEEIPLRHPYGAVRLARPLPWEEPGEGHDASVGFAGQVLEFERRSNFLTGLEFFWLSVETDLGAFDVVAPPHESLGELAVGWVVDTGGWLTARIVGEPTSLIETIRRGSLARIRRHQ